jgi:hypothetical protein
MKRRQDARRGSLAIEMIVILPMLFILYHLMITNHPRLFSQTRIRSGVHYLGLKKAADDSANPGKLKKILNKSLYITQDRNFNLVQPETDYRTHTKLFLTSGVKIPLQQTYYTGGFHEQQVPWGFFYRRGGTTKVESMRGWHRGGDGNDNAGRNSEWGQPNWYQCMATRDSWSYQDIHKASLAPMVSLALGEFIMLISGYTAPSIIYGRKPAGIFNGSELNPSQGTVKGDDLLEL